MPWTVKDVDRHRKGLSDKDKRRWVAVANSVLRRCLASGGSQDTCEAAAIKQANGVVAHVSEEMQSYRLVVNATDIRYETFDGKAYFVVPVVPIREAVLNGYMVSAKEIGAFVDAWNSIPLVCGHPKNEWGEYISAQSPQILEHSIGRFFHAQMQGDMLTGELWVDIEKAQEQGGEALECLTRLEAGKALEVSTGFWSDSTNVPGTFQGQDYLGHRVHIRPNHLALLPNDVGACSTAMGCGAFCTNAACTCTEGDPPMTLDADEKTPGKLRQALRTLFAFANAPEPEPGEDPPKPPEPEPEPEPDEEEDEQPAPTAELVTHATTPPPAPLLARTGGPMLTKQELIGRLLAHECSGWKADKAPVLQALEERVLEEMLYELDTRQQEAPLTLKALESVMERYGQAMRAEFDQKLVTHVQALEEKQERAHLVAYFEGRGWSTDDTAALPLTVMRRMHQELDPVSYMANGLPRMTAPGIDANYPDNDPKME